MLAQSNAKNLDKIEGASAETVKTPEELKAQEQAELEAEEAARQWKKTGGHRNEYNN